MGQTAFSFCALDPIPDSPDLDGLLVARSPTDDFDSGQLDVKPDAPNVGATFRLQPAGDGPTSLWAHSQGPGPSETVRGYRATHQGLRSAHRSAAIQLYDSTQLPDAPAASAASSSAASASPVDLAGAAEPRPGTAADAMASIGARLRGAARRLGGSRELLIVLLAVAAAVMLRPRRSVRALGAS